MAFSVKETAGFIGALFIDDAPEKAEPKFPVVTDDKLRAGMYPRE